MHVLGRSAASETRSPPPASLPTGRLGTYRARDGSDGAAVGVDLDRPHAWLVVGKRGSGKSHTLGVLAEELADASGVTPVVLDPMGGLAGLAAAGLRVVTAPRVRADSLSPAVWPTLVGLDPSSPAGTLVWQAAAARPTLAGMREHVDDVDAGETARRGAQNHLRLADSWRVFAPSGLTPSTLLDGPGVVVDISGLAPAPMNAVVAAVCRGLYEAQLTVGSEGSGDAASDNGDQTGGTASPDTAGALPWVLLDEAHAFFDGIAGPALRTLLTRGRAPGISLVVATQRPSALPAVVGSQADTLLAHRLTTDADIDALAAMVPRALRATVRERLPTERGCAVLVDDATVSVNGVRVRPHRTPHGGAAPRAGDAALDATLDAD